MTTNYEPTEFERGVIAVRKEREAGEAQFPPATGFGRDHCRKCCEPKKLGAEYCGWHCVSGD